MSIKKKIRNVNHRNKDKEGHCREESDLFSNLLHDLYSNDTFLEDLYKEGHNCEDNRCHHALLLFYDEVPKHHVLLVGYFPKSILSHNEHSAHLVVKKPLSVLLKEMPFGSLNIKWELVCDNNMWVLYNDGKITPIEIYNQSEFVQFDPYKLCVYGNTITTFQSIEKAKLVGEKIFYAMKNYIKNLMQSTEWNIKKYKDEFNHKQ